MISNIWRSALTYCTAITRANSRDLSNCIIEATEALVLNLWIKELYADTWTFSAFEARAERLGYFSSFLPIFDLSRDVAESILLLFVSPLLDHRNKRPCGHLQFYLKVWVGRAYSYFWDG